MCVLQFATEAMENEERVGNVEHDVLDRLKVIGQLLDSTLDQ